MVALKKEYADEYAALCQAKQEEPAIHAVFEECNVSSFTVFHKCGLLFCFLEYTGDDIGVDFGRLSSDPEMRGFWELSKRYQEPLYFKGSPDEHWVRLDEIYHPR